MKVVRGLFALAMGLIVAGSLTSIAVHQNPSSVTRYVSVVGTGTVTIVPDTVRFDASITSTDNSSAGALINASKDAGIFRKTLLASGILPKYITTQTLTVNPTYTYSQAGGSKISGYQANQVFSVIIRNAAQAGAIVSAAQNAVGNDLVINGTTSYTFDESSADATARAKAIAQAKEKATNYASLAGATLGKILTIDESVQSSTPGPRPLLMNAASATAPATAQIDLGQQDIAVSVTTEWSIK